MHRPTPWFACLLTLLALALAPLPISAQQDQQDRAGSTPERADNPGEGQNGDRQRSEERPERRRGGRGWPAQFGDDATSKDNPMLERILERYPDADKNKDGVLNAEEARKFMEERRERWRGRNGRNNRNGNRNRVRPTYANIPYGPHRDHLIDLYLASSDEPTPLVVFFHGGQFITGDKRQLGTLDVQALLEAGVSVASVSYRDLGEARFPEPFEDAADAVQFLRFYATQINVDPAKIAGHGEEAGGNLALYLAMHDDLATPASEIRRSPLWQQQEEDGEPASLPSILPEASDDNSPADGELHALAQDGPQPWELPQIATASTRLSCVVARHPLASFDPRSWQKHGLPLRSDERMMRKYLDVRYLDPVDDQDVIELVEAISPLALASSNDPEVLLMSQYTDLPLQENTAWTIMRHHPKQSQLIAEALRANGVQATVRYKEMPSDPGTSAVDFFIKKLN